MADKIKHDKIKHCIAQKKYRESKKGKLYHNKQAKINCPIWRAKNKEHIKEYREKWLKDHPDYYKNYRKNK